MQTQLLGCLALTLGLAAACGGEVVSQDMCGEPGAFKLLELDEDERVLPHSSISMVEERYYITVGHEPAIVESFSLWPSYAKTTTYSVGPCGEDPQIVAEELSAAPFTEEFWPGAALGCQGEARDLVRVDPTGESAPQLVLAGGCDSVTRTDEGRVLRRQVGDDTDNVRLTFHRAAAGEAPAFEPAVELFAAVRDEQILGDEVFGLRDSGELLRVSLVDLEVTVEATNVQDFAASADHLIYSVDGVEPTILLRDRNTADEMMLSPAGIHGLTIRHGAAILKEELPYQNTLVTLEDGEVYPLVGRNPSGPIADGRWLMFGEERIPILRELASGEEEVLTTREGAYSWTIDELQVLEGAAPTGDNRETGALWRISYEGEPEQLLAHRAARHADLLSDGRIVTVVDVDEAWVGELVLVEPETLDELHLAGPVFHYSYSQRRREGLDPNVLIYQVLDGDRTGVYLQDIGTSE